MSERREILRLGVIFIAWFLAMQMAIKYGGIWNSQANPTANVTVTLKDGRSYKGALSREWRGTWQLAQAKGLHVRFDEDTYTVMSFQPTGIRPWEMHWRAWLPVVGVCWACLIAILWPAITQRLR